MRFPVVLTLGQLGDDVMWGNLAGRRRKRHAQDCEVGVDRLHKSTPVSFIYRQRVTTIRVYAVLPGWLALLSPGLVLHLGSRKHQPVLALIQHCQDLHSRPLRLAVCEAPGLPILFLVQVLVRLLVQRARVRRQQAQLLLSRVLQ
jgi:hypothetical protein